jgi:hypothetical protein
MNPMRKLLLSLFLLPLCAQAQLDRLRRPVLIKFVPDTVFNFCRTDTTTRKLTHPIEWKDIWSISVFPDRDTITLDLMTPALSGRSLLELGIDSAEVVDLEGTVVETMEVEYIGIYDFLDRNGGAYRFVINLGYLHFAPVPDAPGEIVFIHYITTEEGEMLGFVAKGDLFYIDQSLADAGP